MALIPDSANDTRICPRCGITEFWEHDSGPDSYDDDIFYTSYSCKGCELWYDSWINKWCDGIDNWRAAQDADEWKYITKKEITAKISYIERLLGERDGSGVENGILELDELRQTIAQSYVSEHDTQRD